MPLQHSAIITPEFERETMLAELLSPVSTTATSLCKKGRWPQQATDACSPSQILLQNAAISKAPPRNQSCVSVFAVASDHKYRVVVGRHAVSLFDRAGTEGSCKDLGSLLSSDIFQSNQVKIRKGIALATDELEEVDVCFLITLAFRCGKSSLQGVPCWTAHTHRLSHS